MKLDTADINSIRMALLALACMVPFILAAHFIPESPGKIFWGFASMALGAAGFIKFYPKIKKK